MCDLETPVIVDMLLFPQIDKHKRPENIYLLYSRRPTTFVFICIPNSLFLKIFDIFSRDRQTDRQTDQPTDRPTDKGRHRSSESGA